MFIFVDDVYGTNLFVRYPPNSTPWLLCMWKTRSLIGFDKICPLVLSVQRQGTGFFGQFVIEVRVLLKLLLGIIG